MHIPFISKSAVLAASIVAFTAPAFAIQVHNEQGGGTVFINNNFHASVAGADNGRFGNLCQDTRPALYSTLSVTEPLPVALDNVVNAFATFPMTLFVTGDGKVYFCGRNPITNVSVFAPTQLPGTENIKVLQAGTTANWREVFLRTADSIYKYSASTQTPVKIYRDYETQEISFGFQHWVMNSRYGAVGYGDNSRGQLGQSVPATVTTPTRLTGIYPIKIQAANNVTVWKDVLSGALISVGSSEYLTPGINPVTIRTGAVADFSVMRNAITILGFDGKLSATGWHNYIGAGLYNWSQFPRVDTFAEFADATAVFAGSDTLWASTPRGLFALGGNTGASGVGTIEESHTWAQVKNFNVSDAMTCTANDALVAENESLKADKALLDSTNVKLTSDLATAKATIATLTLEKNNAMTAAAKANADLGVAKARITYLESLPQLKEVLVKEAQAQVSTTKPGQVTWVGGVDYKTGKFVPVSPVQFVQVKPDAPVIKPTITPAQQKAIDDLVKISSAKATVVAPKVTTIAIPDPIVTKTAPVNNSVVPANTSSTPKAQTTAPVVTPTVSTTTKTACNNGVGNGADGCTPGKAPVANDENGATKGNPAAKGGTASAVSSAKK